MVEKVSLRSIVKGSGISLFGSLFSKSVHYLFYFLLARSLNPDGVGVFSTLLAILGFARIFSLIGFRGGVNRFVAYYRGQNDDARVRGTLRIGFAVGALMGITVAGVVILARPFVTKAVLDGAVSPRLLLVAALLVPLEAYADVTMSALRGFKRIDFQVLSQNVFQGLVKVGGFAALVWLGYDDVGAAVASYGLSIFVTMVLGLYFIERRTFSIVHGESTYEVRKLLVFSFPLLLTGTLSQIVDWTDVLMINYFGTNAQAGIYNIALQTGLVVTLGLTSVSSITGPMLSELVGKDDWKDVGPMLKIANKWVMLITAPMVVFLVPFSRDIVRVFGPEFATGGEVLLILGFGIFVKSTLGLSDTLLTSMGRTKVILFNHVVAAVLNVGLNYVLIPQYGILGAAIATGISVTLDGILPTVQLYGWHGIIPFRTDFAYPLLASLLAVVVTEVTLSWALEVHYLAVLPIGMIYLVIYGVAFLLVGGLAEEDVYILQAVKERTGFENERLERFVLRFT